MRPLLLVLALFATATLPARAADRIPVTVEAPAPGAPVTFGLPMPVGALHSPDHVRVLDGSGREIPSQITEVTTWEPADGSIKWIWVMFFVGDGPNYTVEYGEDVVRARYDGPRVTVVNNQRPGGAAEITTGPLRLSIPKGNAGFLDDVSFDWDGDGLDDGDRIAHAPANRGSFLDLLDQAGMDPSGVTVVQTFKERGSGPLHAIVRVEGTYAYGRGDNNPAPFVMRIHAYAGQPFVRVLHTLTYTGEPDQYPRRPGEHANIATSGDTLLIDEDARTGDPRWQQPEDRIAAAGLGLKLGFDGPVTCQAGYRAGNWWGEGTPQVAASSVTGTFEVLQTGPEVYGVTQYPEPSSGPGAHMDGFAATLSANGQGLATAERADGWMRCADGQKGVAVGIRYFFEEYPSGLSYSAADSLLTLSLWPESADPMQFTRYSADASDGGMMGNYAQGLTKTSELIVHFLPASESLERTQRVLGYVLDPPVAHATPQWYADSGAYGHFATAANTPDVYERGLEYKFAWWRFNQKWEPWYGFFNHGDGKAYYFRDDWVMWLNNEPGTDYMWWLQFMRTGSRDAYLAAQATSRHTMDVDNIHWPAPERYRGDTNDAVDAFRAEQQPAGTPYLGIGRRHGWQQWSALLSAHVWTPGWVADYYLAADHRGLDIARLTADTYLKRIWGEHDLRGRRLYLSVWNLAEVWDATKDPRYAAEVGDRVGLMLALQREQGGQLVIDRYGYSQVYVTNGLQKIYQMTGDERVAEALVKHARFVRDNPPLNHEMESFLASIGSLVAGYAHSGEPTLLETAIDRAQYLETDALPGGAFASMTQGQLKTAMENVSHLPGGDGGGSFAPIWRISNGLRIFGWTHIYNVPALAYWMNQAGMNPHGTH